MSNTTYTISHYTVAWDDAVASHGGGLARGDTYRIPEDPQGTGCTCDAREWDAFSRRMREAHLVEEYSHTEDGYDYYDLAAGEGFAGGFKVGDRVTCNDTVPEDDRESGRIIEVLDNGAVVVGWDSGTRTATDVDILEAEE